MMSKRGGEKDRRMDDKWMFDKKIPIALIVVLVLQASSFVWWAATTESRITDHDRRILVAESTSREAAHADIEFCQRLARVEEKVTTAILSLSRIESAIISLHKGG